MSDTPRTDAIAADIRRNTDDQTRYYLMAGEFAHLSRTIERELAAARAQVAEAYAFTKDLQLDAATCRRQIAEQIAQADRVQTLHEGLMEDATQRYDALYAEYTKLIRGDGL